MVVRRVVEVSEGGGKKKILHESQDSTTIKIRPFKSAPAQVSLSVGETINMGNYESARVDVGLQLPVYPEEVLEDGGDRVCALIRKIITKQLGIARRELGGE